MTDDPFGSASEGDPAGGPDTSELEESVEDTKQLNVEIPARLHRELKAHCARSEEDMKDVVRRLLESELDS